MDRETSALRIAKNYERQMEENGFFVCEHCNGTGINPKYQKQNEMVKVLDGYDAFFCLFCYGMKQIDCVDYMMGNFPQEMENRKIDINSLFLYLIYSYVLYLIHGQNRFDKKLNKWIHYDVKNQCWVESTRTVGSLKGQYVASDMMLNSADEGYTDGQKLGDFITYAQGDFFVYPVEIIKNIKAELINSAEMTLARLEEIKEELELIGITIDELERFPTEEGLEKKLSLGFKFNWENILKRFDLSKAHLPALRRLSYKESVLKFIFPDDDIVCI